MFNRGFLRSRRADASLHCPVTLPVRGILPPFRRIPDEAVWSRAWQSAALVVAAFASLVSVHARAATPAEIRVDYAYYSPESAVIRHFGWLEDEFKADRTSIRWVLSLGSNRALEYLNSGAVDFGSAAGLASVLARTATRSIRSTCSPAPSGPRWWSWDSPIRSLADLKGKKIAATRGTDPFLFTLRALHTVGLTRDDVEIVNLQHPDGRTALNGVDAWPASIRTWPRRGSTTARACSIAMSRSTPMVS